MTNALLVLIAVLLVADIWYTRKMLTRSRVDLQQIQREAIEHLRKERSAPDSSTGTGGS